MKRFVVGVPAIKATRVMPAGDPGHGGHGGGHGHGHGHMGHAHGHGHDGGGGWWGGWWYPYYTSMPVTAADFLARAGYTCAMWKTVSPQQRFREVNTLLMSGLTIREGGAMMGFESDGVQSFIATVNAYCG